MQPAPFSASGSSFRIHEWRGSGPALLHEHHSDDEAWQVLDGELTFRYARYSIVITPRLSALIAALQADRDRTHQHEIYRQFDSDLLE